MSNAVNARNIACALLVLFYDSGAVARKRVESYNGNTGSNPVRVAGYRKHFMLSHLYRSLLDDFIILLTDWLRYPLKSIVSKPSSEFWL
jgi:hypothetical protein